MLRFAVSLVAGLCLATGVSAHDEPVLQFLKGHDLLSIDVHELHDVTFDDVENGTSNVHFRMSEKAGRRLWEFTTRHVGHSIEVLLCEEVLVQPVVQSPIFGSALMLPAKDSKTARKVAARLSGQETCH